MAGKGIARPASWQAAGGSDPLRTDFLAGVLGAYFADTPRPVYRAGGRQIPLIVTNLEPGIRQTARLDRATPARHPLKAQRR